MHVGKLKYIIVAIVLLASSLRSFPTDIRIGIFHSNLVNAFLFTPGEGDYRVEIGHVSPPGTCPQGESWYILRQKDSLLVRDHTGRWFSGKTLRFIAPDEYAWFRIKPAWPVLDTREYQGDLRAGIAMNSLLMVNEIDMEKYIMGVSETEAGTRCELEYYKVQAILSRTFAYRNLERHKSEGFHLCDGVHCQAYKGRNIWNEDVEIGTEVTSGLVLADADSLLINAAYHANSGGETRGGRRGVAQRQAIPAPRPRSIQPGPAGGQVAKNLSCRGMDTLSGGKRGLYRRTERYIPARDARKAPPGLLPDRTGFTPVVRDPG